MMTQKLNLNFTSNLEVNVGLFAGLLLNNNNVAEAFYKSATLLYYDTRVS